MSQPIRGKGGNFVFPIGPKNTSLVEDVQILLPVKFLWIPLSGFRGEVENVSANQRPGRSFCFLDRPKKKHKLGRGRADLASCQVSLNSVQSFQRRSWKCLSQSEARAAILFFRSAQKHKLGCTSSTKLVFFFWPIEKTKWPPWPLIGWDIFNFSSETAERNSKKLDRKQDLHVLYQVCVFGPIGKTKWLPLPLIDWDIFNFSSENSERNSKKLDRKQDLHVLYQACVFWADRKNKIAALASDWLRHFQLLLWKRRTEFNKTWQEARSQRPLPSLCFSNRSEKQNCRPGLWLVETFSTSSLKPLNGIQGKFSWSKISTFST